MTIRVFYLRSFILLSVLLLLVTDYNTNLLSAETATDSTGKGNLIWAKRAGGAGNDGAMSITTLTDNSIVVAGCFDGLTTFGEDKTNSTILAPAGNFDIFIAKYSSDGTLVWVKRAGGISEDAICGITALSDNSTVVTGQFTISATFGVGEVNETVLTSYGHSEIFIARYNPDGTLAWAKCPKGPKFPQHTVFGITTLSDDSTVMTGCFYDSATFGPGEINETLLTSIGSGDIFIARYNPDGSLAWAKRAGGSGSDGANGVTSLSDDSIVMTGVFFDSAAFGEGEINQNVLTSEQCWDIFVARYNPDGTTRWAKSAGGTGSDAGHGVISLSDDSTIATGYFDGSITFGKGETNQTILTSAGKSDIFIARYNPDGALVWAERDGGSSFEIGEKITSLADNSIIVTGFFSESATFGSGGSNPTVLSSIKKGDSFIARYNTDGTLVWAKNVSGSNSSMSYGITTLSDNSTVVSGFFSDSVIFGQGESNETTLNSAGGGDIFIARFTP